MFKKLSLILEKKDQLKLKFIFVLNSLMFFLELITLASVPFFVTSILKPEIIISKFSEFFSFQSDSFFVNNLILIASIFVIISFLLKNIFLVLLLIYQGNFFRKLKINISKKLFYFYTDASFLYHLNNNPSQLARNVTDEIIGVYNYLFNLTLLIRESVAILVIFLLVVIIDPLSAFSICLFLGLISILNIKKIKPYLKIKAINNQKVRKNIIQTIFETFGSIKDIKIFNQEHSVKKYFDNNVAEFEKNAFHFVIFSRLPRILLEVLSIVGIIIISFFYLTFLQNSGNLFPILSLLAISVMRFIPAFNSVVLAVYFLKIYQQSLKLITKEIELINRENFNEQNKNLKVIKESSSNQSFLSVENLNYEYKGRDGFKLTNINFSIEQGKKIAITGSTGSGKSTLFYLMLGLIKPTEGAVFYKGENIFKNLKNWRKEIGYISQNIYLLDASIKKNIAFNFLDENIDEKRLKTAIEIAHLNEKISSLDESFDTQVGADGLTFSGGERQRIAIARAIYRQPEIFFMDEFTSALDTKTEDKILSNFHNYLPKSTVIMIAHRKETIQKCDEVWKIENGKLIKLPFN
jgi:ATP-binding cassette, subfamily B, bacterial PglK